MMRGHSRNTCFGLGLLFSLGLLAGCATHADHLRDIRGEFHNGDLAAAGESIDRQLKRGKRKEADVLKLERAMVELCGGRPDRAEQTLREVRDRLDYLEQTSLGESALAMATDDNARSYAGEDYEKVLIRAFLALSNLMHDGSDAAAYGLQVTDKQNQIIQAGIDKSGENPKLAYKRVALGAYVHGAMIEATHSNYDDVARARAHVVSWQPNFRAGHADLQRSRHGVHSQPGHGVLYVFTLVGRGPYKEEVSEIPSTVSLLIADRIISALGKHTLPPTIAPIKVPKVVLSRNQVNTVHVAVDGSPFGSTETITDVGQLAVQQYEAIFPRVLARAVVRRAVKKGAIYAAKEAVGVEKNGLASFAMDLGGVVWEATESADTRCWGLLPDKIQVLRLELPVGQHHIGLKPGTSGFGIGVEQGTTVEIADGRNTYMLACFPDTRLVGQILTSTH